MLETAGRDAHAIDEGVEVGGLEADNPSHLVGGELPLVDESVERAQCHPEPLAGLPSPHPLDQFAHREHLTKTRKERVLFR